MTRICEGKPLEKILWVVALLIIVMFTSHTIYENTVRFLAYGVKTESIEKEKANLPVITVCLESTFPNYVPCYNNDHLYFNTNCKVESASESEMWYYNKHGEKEKKGKDLGKNCHVFNENGTIEDYKEISVESFKENNDSLVVMFHTPHEFALRKEIIYIKTFDQHLKLEPGSHELFINEKSITRLPHPYSSNCTDGDQVSNTFSDRYTHDSCRETCLYEHMFKECDDVIDVWKKYLPVNMKPPNSTQLTSRKNCIRNVLEKGRRFANCACKCACKETVYTIEKKGFQQYNHNLWYLQLNKQHVVTEVKLVPDFPPEQFLGTFGGVLGLGGKFQILFQLIVFIFLCMGHLIARNR